jgi:hypothetical protein
MIDSVARQEPDAARTPDVALALGCALAALAASLYASRWFGPFVIFESFDNVYFQTDASLVYSNMTERLANHYRTAMHPAFSLVFWPVVSLLRLLGLEPVTAVRWVLGVNAGASGALIYLILRKSGLLPWDAVLFALSFAGSVALLFFGSVPETFTFGGTTLLLVLFLLAMRPRPSAALLLAANAASMSMTLTNWMAGVVATLRTYPRDFRVWLRVFGGAAFIIGACGVITRNLFGSSGFTGDFREYVQWVRWPRLSDLRSFLVHSTVMPEPLFRPTAPGVLESTVEPVGVGAGSALALICAVLWLVLLCAGAFAVASRARRPELRDVLVVTVAGQLALHLCFSDGPFLFIGHFAPLLLLVAAHVRLLPLPKWPTRAAVAALLAAIALNNVLTHQATVRRFERDVLPWMKVHGVERIFLTPEMFGRASAP